MTSDRTLLYATDRLHANLWNDCIHSLALAEDVDILLAVVNVVDFANPQSVIQTDANPMKVCLNEAVRVLLAHWSCVVRTEAFQEFELCYPCRNQFGYSHEQAGFTPAYVAPGLAVRDNTRITERTLVYHCGATL